MIAAAIAVGMKVVGILLIVSLLIIPAAAARRLSATPEHMAVAAVAIGVASVLLGLASSLQWDLPAGPSIVLAASLIFAVLVVAPRRGGAGSP
jgi:zinc transport system permease protein